MAFKPLKESEELLTLRSLNERSKLSEDDVKNYYYLEKGYQGEKKFDAWLSKLDGKWLTLNSLNLIQNNNFFQIDSSILFQGILHNINVKNFEGDYYIEDGNWFSPKKEIRNPLDQLKRSEIFLKQLLLDHRINIPIESYLVFVNPEFQLYNAERNLPIIFPAQHNRYKEKLFSIPSELNETHYEIAEKLTSLSLKRSPYSILPTFNYEDLKLGLISKCGHSFISNFKKHILVCDTCGSVESVESGVLRSIEEFQLLNPDRMISVTTIYEWCKIIPKRTIQRILSKNYKIEGYGKYLHYIKK